MGVILLVIGLAVLGFGLFNMMAAKRVLAAPFKKTGELAKNPVSEDPKGAMSTEGKVVPPATQLLSPATKQPCLAYELKIERLFEKTETTQDGTKTVKGSETLDTIKGGTVFGLDDGSGPFNIDVTKGADFDNMKEGFKKEINGNSGSSHIQFGEYSYDVPAIGSDKGWTIGFKATESYVPVEGNLFVLGKLEGSSLVKPGWRSMMTSAKGREGLLGALEKKKKFSFIGGGVASVLAIPLMIFGPKADPNALGASCPSELTDVRLRCSSQVTDEDTYTWTVTKPGTYAVSVFAPAKKVAFDPGLSITDATGTELADVEGGVGGNAVAAVDVKAGTYKVKVYLADNVKVSGGYSYEMEIANAGGAAPVLAANPGSDEQGEAPEVDATPLKIKAPMLAAEFMKNADAAVSTYGDRNLEVTGLVKAVKGQEAWMEVPEMEGKFAALIVNLPAKSKVKKGQVITARGLASVDDGEHGFSVTLLDATLVK